jgi:hypothetical protein
MKMRRCNERKYVCRGDEVFDEVADEVSGEEDDFLLWWELPGVSLSQGDREVLVALHQSLHQAPRHATQFLHYIMLSDFPPQIFLNNPHIIKVIFILIYNRCMGLTD